MGETHILIRYYFEVRGGGSLVARLSHDQEIVGSNPTRATRHRTSQLCT
jgi:hypothetical protein